MTNEPCDNAIRELAYILWELRGRPSGAPEVDWYRAERELRNAYRSVPLSSFESMVMHDTGSTSQHIAFVRKHCP